MGCHCLLRQEPECHTIFDPSSTHSIMVRLYLLKPHPLLSDPSTVIQTLAISGLNYSKRLDSPPAPSLLFFKLSLCQLLGCIPDPLPPLTSWRVPTVSWVSPSSVSHQPPLPHKHAAPGTLRCSAQALVLPGSLPDTPNLPRISETS